PIGDNQEDYDVLENGVVVGRIFHGSDCAAGPPLDVGERPQWQHQTRGTAMSRHARRQWRRSRRVGEGKLSPRPSGPSHMDDWRGRVLGMIEHSGQENAHSSRLGVAASKKTDVMHYTGGRVVTPLDNHA